MATSWTILKLEATTACNFLGQKLPLPFQPTEEGVGWDSVSGETRTKLIKSLESLRSKVLTKALERVHPRSAREAWAWRQCGKVSSA